MRAGGAGAWGSWCLGEVVCALECALVCLCGGRGPAPGARRVVTAQRRAQVEPGLATLGAPQVGRRRQPGAAQGPAGGAHPEPVHQPRRHPQALRAGAAAWGQAVLAGLQGGRAGLASSMALTAHRATPRATAQPPPPTTTTPTTPHHTNHTAHHPPRHLPPRPRRATPRASAYRSARRRTGWRPPRTAPRCCRSSGAPTSCRPTSTSGASWTARWPSSSAAPGPAFDGAPAFDAARRGRQQGR